MRSPPTILVAWCLSMQTVDFKAECADPCLAALLCERAGAVHIATISQTDTYFRIPDAHLLRRQSAALSPHRLEASDTLAAGADLPASASGGADWLYFTRPRRCSPRVCVAILYSERAALARFGVAPMPMWVIVQKERSAWAMGDVRIHLDEVAGLGKFVEFEARVGPRRSVARCVMEIARARAALRSAMGEPLSGGYAELMAFEQESGLHGAPLPPPDILD